jgi:hypothetical protein
MTIEELLRKAEEYRKDWERHFNNVSFWQALWLALKEFDYYGGGIVDAGGGKMFKINSEYDAIDLLLYIYDTYKDIYNKKEEAENT